MKKVIFISALAIAAAVSCTKSDIVDTKFDEQISFESYVGRDAMTKASVETVKTIGKVGVYGYYEGAQKTYNAATSEANLWNPLTLVVSDQGVAQQPTGNDVRYWTNDSDFYTFLAYAPMDEVTVSGNGINPTIEYTVSSELDEQVDVLCAQPQIGRKKDDGNVALVFEHKLARLTVKARATAGNFNYHIKRINLSGTFNTSGKLPLANPTEWKDVTPVQNTVYSFPTVGTDALPKPATAEATVDYKDYAGTENYLMMIPVDFSKEEGEGENKTYPDAATLTVVYTTSYMAGEQQMESIEYTKTFPVTTNFVMGKAYAIALDFIQATNNDIKFSVSVENWKNVAGEDNKETETEHEIN